PYSGLEAVRKGDRAALSLPRFRGGDGVRQLGGGDRRARESPSGHHDPLQRGHHLRVDPFRRRNHAEGLLARALDRRALTAGAPAGAGARSRSSARRAPETPSPPASAPPRTPPSHPSPPSSRPP